MGGWPRQSGRQAHQEQHNDTKNTKKEGEKEIKNNKEYERANISGGRHTEHSVPAAKIHSPHHATPPSGQEYPGSSP